MTQTGVQVSDAGVIDLDAEGLDVAVKTAGKRFEAALCLNGASRQANNVPTDRRAGEKARSDQYSRPQGSHSLEIWSQSFDCGELGSS